ncbi:signal peptidase I [Nocardioides panacisoli]|uniref:Signal peptidase I n=1 Tax=Nocardioides panacisoli TaxID=627624 RepID=A0ABP7I880_9ACTN
MSTSEHRRTTIARRTGRWAVSTATLLVILFCLAWIAPSLFGFSRYVITGPSMTGTYDRGSVVFEKPVDVADLEVGDVITYTPPADTGVTWLVTHRIVDIEPAEGGGLLFTTKGDHNPDPDPWHFQLVDQDQPVVQAGVPYVGWLFIALADKQTRMLAIGVPALLIALGALRQLVSATRETVRERRRPAALEA